MGLDVTVYPKAALTTEHTLSDDCWETTPSHVHTGRFNFPQSHRGLIENRCYVAYGDAPSWGFRAGSYGGYNEFRRLLTQAAYGHAIDPHYVWENLDKFRDKPFFELIDFSDCEGCIGPEACTDLAKDFDDWPAMRESMVTAGWEEIYDEWNKAFHDAAGKGLVDFH